MKDVPKIIKIILLKVKLAHPGRTKIEIDEDIIEINNYIKSKTKEIKNVNSGASVMIDIPCKGVCK